MNTHKQHLLWASLSDTPPTHCFKLFFLFSNVGRGNEGTVAAGLNEIPSEAEENHKQDSFSLQNMVNKTKVRRNHACFNI